MVRHYSRAEIAQVMDHMFGTLLPGATPQGIEELSTSQKYEIGSRLQLLNKVYHYALVGVGADGLAAGMGAKVRNQQDIGFRAIAAGGAVAAGARSILVDITADDGPEQSGAFPENYLRGGTVIVRTAVTNFNRGIVSHPAKVLGVGTLLLQLDAPIPVDIIVGNQVEAVASRYAQVVRNTNTIAAQVWTPVSGIPTIDAPAGNFTWLQTWGPCSCIGAVTVGGAGSNLAVYANDDGALAPFATHSGIQQYIGYVMSSGTVGGAQGAPFVQLQLDP